MSKEIEILMPKAVRPFIVSFGVVWCGFALFLAVLAATTVWPVSLPLFAAFAVGASATFRWTRVGVFATDDQLVVRNFFRTHRVARDEIDDFALVREGGVRVAPHALSVGWVFEIEAQIHGGKVLPLTATRRPRLLPRAPKSEQDVAELRDWIQRGRAVSDPVRLVHRA